MADGTCSMLLDARVRVPGLAFVVAGQARGFLEEFHSHYWRHVVLSLSSPRRDGEPPRVFLTLKLETNTVSTTMLI